MEYKWTLFPSQSVPNNHFLSEKHIFVRSLQRLIDACHRWTTGRTNCHSVFFRSSGGFLLTVALPPKQLFAPRLANSTISDDILAYTRCKANCTLSRLSCLKLRKDGFPDRMIAFFKVTSPYNFDTQFSFWPQGIFIKSYERVKIRQNFPLPRRTCIIEDFLTKT